MKIGNFFSKSSILLLIINFEIWSASRPVCQHVLLRVIRLFVRFCAFHPTVHRIPLSPRRLLACKSTEICFPEIWFFFSISDFFQGIGITNWVLAYESIPMRLRAYTMMVFGLWWAFGYCLVGPMAALLPNWRWLVIVASAPSLVVGILYYLWEKFGFLQENRISIFWQLTWMTWNFWNSSKISRIRRIKNFWFGWLLFWHQKLGTFFFSHRGFFFVFLISLWFKKF